MDEARALELFDEFHETPEGEQAWQTARNQRDGQEGPEWAAGTLVERFYDWLEEFRDALIIPEEHDDALWEAAYGGLT